METIPHETLGNGLTEYIISTGQGILIEQNLPKKLSQLGVNLVGRPAKSWVGAPLVADGHVLAVMAVQNFEREFLYDRNHLRVLSTIASQAAGAIKTTRLFSELRATKDQLEYIMKSTLANTAKSFVGELFYDTVAHDLKNLVLATVSTIDELIDNPGLKKLARTQQRSVTGLAQRIKLSSETIKKYLEVSRSADPEASWSDLNRLTEQTLDLHTLTLSDRDIKVELSLPESLPGIRIHPMDPMMIISNLITNAITALEKVSRQRLLTVEAEVSKDKQWIELSVEDNGCGIRKGFQQKIFEPYVSGDDSRGKGLGLFGIKRIMRLHGGNVTLASRFGKGSKFTVRFPIKLTK